MNAHLTISYNTRDPGLSAYRVTITATDDALRPLQQSGPVYNDVVTYDGILGSKVEAAAAVSRYVAMPHVLVEYTDMLTGERRIKVERYDRRAIPALGWRRATLASVSVGGTWITA
jgi:hypothetical protein